MGLLLSGTQALLNINLEVIVPNLKNTQPPKLDFIADFNSGAEMMQTELLKEQ